MIVGIISAPVTDFNLISTAETIEYNVLSPKVRIQESESRIKEWFYCLKDRILPTWIGSFARLCPVKPAKRKSCRQLHDGSERPAG
jgi:hypothetical protein